MLREHAAHQSYVFTGPVGISLDVADDLTTGRFRVRSQSVAKVSQSSGDFTRRKYAAPAPCSSSTASTCRSGLPAW